MAFTPYSLEMILNFMFNSQSVTRPTSWYLAWHTGLPGDDGADNEQTVGGDANYARQSITFDSSTWSTVTKKRWTANTNTISITPASLTSYTVYGFSVWDSLTGGNCLISGETKEPLAVSDVSPISLIAGKVPVTLSRKDGFGRTSYGAGIALDWLLTTDSVTRPTDWYVSLHTGDPGDDGTANEVTTGDDPDYTRKSTDFGASVTASEGDTYVRNTVSAIWVPGAGANYTAPYAAIFDALSGGNCLNTIACSPARQGVDGETLSVAANGLTIIEIR